MEKEKFSINGIKVSNLITYGLALKNLGSHYIFVRKNNNHKLLKYNNITSPYLCLRKLIIDNKKIHNVDAIIQDRNLTYNELLEEVDKFSNYIHDNIETKKGENVSICSSSSLEGVVSFFSLNKLGLVNARVFNGCKEEKMLYNINNFNSKILITDSNNISVVNNIINNTKVKDIILLNDCDETILNSLKNKGINIHKYHDIQKKYHINNDYTEYTTKDDVASILYTSGSNGEAKPITISNKAYVNMVEIVSKTTNVKKCESEKVLGVVSHEYPYAAINSTVMILLLGKTLVMKKQLSNSKPEDILLENKDLNRIQAIPNYYKLIEASNSIEDLSELKYVISGGEHYLLEEKKKLLRFLKKNNSNALLIDGFGFGEMASATALKFGLSEYFMLMNGIEAKAINPETREELKNGEEGILCLSGPAIADGYYNNEEATKKSFIVDENGKKWFISDTYGSVHGIFKRFIKLGGRIREYFITDDGTGNFVKVYSGNVEDVISSIDFIEDCIVVPSDSSAIPRTVAYISLVKDCGYSNEQIIKIINDKCNLLEDFAKPVEINIESMIERTDAGKKNYLYYRKKREF